MARKETTADRAKVAAKKAVRASMNAKAAGGSSDAKVEGRTAKMRKMEALTLSKIARSQVIKKGKK